MGRDRFTFLLPPNKDTQNGFLAIRRASQAHVYVFSTAQAGLTALRKHRTEIAEDYAWFRRIVQTAHYSKKATSELVDITGHAGKTLGVAVWEYTSILRRGSPPFYYVENETERLRFHLPAQKKSHQGMVSFYRENTDYLYIYRSALQAHNVLRNHADMLESELVAFTYGEVLRSAIPRRAKQPLIRLAGGVASFFALALEFSCLGSGVANTHLFAPLGLVPEFNDLKKQ